MNIQFLGASGTVTGSKYLLDTGGKRYLIDCGLFQGLRSLRERNWNDPDFNPKDISAVFITHAHIDHTGYLPRLFSLGFDGPVYSSKATFELSQLLLPDSGHLQEEEARFINERGYSRHKPALPLYTRVQAEEALKSFVTVDFHRKLKINGDVTVTFYRAGHILGASFILFESKGKKIIFSGDVGKNDDLLMKPPESMPNADYIVLESTYGNRSHEQEDLFETFANIINDAVKHSSVVLIPAFAVGRAQLILYILDKLTSQHKIPNIITYLDSPMAIDTTYLYCDNADEHRLNEDSCRLMYKNVVFTKTQDESRNIKKISGPKIIISASGMASGGRIMHHLTHYLADKNNVVIIAGYQADGTNGRRLLDGAQQLKIFGEYIPVRAQIKNIFGLSAHADQDELVQWLEKANIPKVFLTHGEPKAAEALALSIKKKLGRQVVVPKDGEKFSL